VTICSIPGDGAQIACNRLLLPDQLDAGRLHAAPHVVDFVVAGDDAPGQDDVAPFQGWVDVRIASETRGTETNDIEPGVVERLMVGCTHIRTTIA